MNFLRRFSLIVLVLAAALVSSAAFAENTPKSVGAKLFWAAKLMESHDNWLKVSSLLDEVLEADLDNDFVRSRVKAVKEYVDREPARRKTSGRLQTHKFLEARLLLVECIQEMRPRLNNSWDGEVRHAQNLIRSAIFPGDEDLGEIVFPAPSTYSFDLYGYTIQNIKATLTLPGGKQFEALFPEFLSEQKKATTTAPSSKRPMSTGPMLDEAFGSHMTFERLTAVKDRMRSFLLDEGINADIDSSEWDPSRGGDKKDDLKFGDGSDTQQVISAVIAAYGYVKDALGELNNKRTIDEYEPLTLMMIALANPKLIDEDPQLKAFTSGVKLRYRLADEGVDGVSFKTHDYELVEMLNDALSPSAKVKLRFEVDSSSGRTALWLVSNLNGDSNSFVLDVLTFKNIVRTVQAVRYMPDATATWIKSVPENLPKFPGALGEWISKLSKSDNIIYKVAGSPLRVVFDLTVGRKTVSKAAESTSKFIEKVAAKPSMQKAYSIAKSDGFLRVMVGVTVAADLTEGVIKYLHAATPEDQAEIVIHSGSKIGSDLLYLAPYKRVVRGVLVLDVAHLFLDKVPNTAEVIEKVAGTAWGFWKKATTGVSPSQLAIRKMKSRLGITNDQTQAIELLAEFENGIKEAQTLEELEKAREILREKVGTFAAQRLTFHYAMLMALGGKSDGSNFGEELFEQYKQYEKMMNGVWFVAPGTKDKTEQAGLRLLRRDFDEKWVKLGGTPPRKPKALQ